MQIYTRLLSPHTLFSRCLLLVCFAIGPLVVPSIQAQPEEELVVPLPASLVIAQAVENNPSSVNFTTSSIGPYHGYANTISVAGDLDGDGDQDLLLAGTYSQVHLNDGAGRFSAFGRPIEFLGNETSDAALGDLDADGDLDALLGRPSKPSQIFLNDGRGLFSPGPVLNPAGSPNERVALFDADSDGDTDALLGNRGTPSQIFLNDGRGRFSLGSLVGTAEDMTARSGEGDLAVGDLDNDGDQDLLFAGEQGGQIYLNDRSGNYSAGQRIAFLTNYDITAVIGDLNNDGSLDLILADAVDSTRVYLNNGQASFQLGSLLEEFNFGPKLDLALGDIDGDNDNDLAIAVACIPAISCSSSLLYLNDGSAGFRSITSTMNSFYSAERILLRNIDGDRDLDIILSGVYYGYDRVPARIAINEGAQTFTNYDLDPLLDDKPLAAIGDLDNDGDKDVLAISGPRSLVYLNCRNNPVQQAPAPGTNRLFLPLIRQAATGECAALDGFAVKSSSLITASNILRGELPALGDLDGDGDLDAVMRSHVYLNDGRANFSLGSPIGLTEFSSAAVGDLNSDGDLDLITLEGAIYLNDGVAGFTLHETVSDWLYSSYTPLLGDLDQDGDLDLAGSGKVYLNDGAANFTLDFAYASISALGDIDGDGDPDALGRFDNANSNDRRLISVLRNDGTGRLAASSAIGAADAAALGDLDGDGDLDAALQSNNGSGRTFLNQRADGFIEGWAWEQPAPLSSAIVQIVITDLDGDGANDLVATATDTPLHFFRNNRLSAQTSQGDRVNK